MPSPEHPPAFLFYPRDFSNDGKVEAMNTEEVGAYILLLCKSWREDPPGSIPDDDCVLARWARLTPDRWSVCRTSVLAAFTLGTDSRWHQKRLRREYERLMERKRENQKAAKSRWHKDVHASALPSQSLAVAVPVASAKKEPKPKTIVQQKPLDATPFYVFWDLYPRREAKAKALLKWERMSNADRNAALAGIHSWRESGRWDDPRFIPMPATYLNGRRWEDEITPRTDSSRQSYRDAVVHREAMVGSGPEIIRVPEIVEPPPKEFLDALREVAGKKAM